MAHHLAVAHIAPVLKCSSYCFFFYWHKSAFHRTAATTFLYIYVHKRIYLYVRNTSMYVCYLRLLFSLGGATTCLMTKQLLLVENLQQSLFEWVNYNKLCTLHLHQHNTQQSHFHNVDLSFYFWFNLYSTVTKKQKKNLMKNTYF